MNNACIIAGGHNQIWAINSKTKQKLIIESTYISKPKLTKILDMYVTSKGIYYAKEVVESETKKLHGEYYEFFSNHIEIVDALSGKPGLSIFPSWAPKRDSAINKRVKMNFNFVRENNSLLYFLQDENESVRDIGFVFENFKPVSQNDIGFLVDFYRRNISPERVDFLNNDVYHNYRKIATLDDEVTFAQQISMDTFSKMLRIKDKHKYRRNKEFFK